MWIVIIKKEIILKSRKLPIKKQLIASNANEQGIMKMSVELVITNSRILKTR